MHPPSPQAPSLRSAVWRKLPLSVTMAALHWIPSADGAPSAPDFHQDIAPILRDFCAGCHNQKDAEEGLSVETYAELLKGSDDNKVLTPGDIGSHLLRVMKGEKPAMPPKKEPQPSPSDVALIERWIAAGAPGPRSGDVSILDLVTLPDLPIKKAPAKAVTAAAQTADCKLSAIARHGIIEIQHASSEHPLRVTAPGKVNQLQFSPDGKQLIVATGQAGRSGLALLLSSNTGAVLKTFKHQDRDLLHSAVFSPTGKYIALAGYEGVVSVFQTDSESAPVHILKAHTGAVFDLAFSPDGMVLASASADQTIKLWRVSNGERLDTLNQPQGEQTKVRFTSDSKHILAAGSDRRIRIWEFHSKEKPATNPLLETRFAHEAPISQLYIDDAQKVVVSSAGDRSMRAWSLPELSPLKVFESQSDVITAMLPGRSPGSLRVQRFDGSSEEIVGLAAVHRSSTNSKNTATEAATSAAPPTLDIDTLALIAENEIKSGGNSRPLPIPSRTLGCIGQRGESDSYSFIAKKGARIVLEVIANRNGSPLKSSIDARVEVRNEQGQKVTRALLQAVRSSWLSFRGQDSMTVTDFRLQHQSEMALNELLYCDGELVKLWMAPRGPDSGFNLFPGAGQRHTYLDTTAVAHAMGSPAYIVHALSPNSAPPKNGLPLFTLYYENDDDALRVHGTDPVLHFTAPADGIYSAVVTDTRGFGGTDFPYELRLRPAHEDFHALLTEGEKALVSPGGGRPFRIKIERRDEFDGPVSVEFKNLPPGFRIPSPILVEAGQTFAFGAIYADRNAPPPPQGAAAAIRMIARAQMPWGEVVHEASAFNELKLGAAPKISVEIVPDESTPVVQKAPGQPLEIRIRPGQTITAKVKTIRHDFNDRIEFGNDRHEPGLNLPHGVIVDNLGLNGLLVVEGETERQFFLTAAKWVQGTTRPFFILAKADGGQASTPVVLRVDAE
jgi:WD40 repeat protein